ncbi:TetR/AcrR family transcriptional regulator [Pseudonocardia sulfidoxydans]|uniref:TetR/AcrR family transcriptional regulator n=1 Tax=Pseudonocardia sulfidoxydans TaxID=54011 RepID=UPI0011BF6431|nr:TetR/AcrR family transcriptional regulator [Pseudonocardia sulfidoxydans]
MSGDVKTRRPYRAPRRAEGAARTRAAVLASARELFVAKGYRRTTVADVADGAGVAVDTVYATVGRKPVILRELVETALSGTDEAVPGPERDYVTRMRAADGAAQMLAIYAAAIGAIHPRLGPVFLALRDAAVQDPACATLWAEIAQRRAANMRHLAAELRATGELRPDLDDDTVADIVWSTNAVEYWLLLVGERGWSTERFVAHLTDMWTRTLLAPR